jgi:hypothetical protein
MVVMEDMDMIAIVIPLIEVHQEDMMHLPLLIIHPLQDLEDQGRLIRAEEDQGRHITKVEDHVRPIEVLL